MQRYWDREERGKNGKEGRRGKKRENKIRLSSSTYYSSIDSKSVFFAEANSRSFLKKKLAFLKIQPIRWQPFRTSDQFSFIPS